MAICATGTFNYGLVLLTVSYVDHVMGTIPCGSSRKTASSDDGFSLASHALSIFFIEPRHHAVL